MKYQCPCCGFYTLEENASGEICPVCFWERDKASEEEPGFEGGANNGISLNQARKNYVSFGACDEKLVTYVRAPKEEEKTSGPSVEDQQERLEKQTLLFMLFVACSFFIMKSIRHTEKRGERQRASPTSDIF